MKYTEVVQNLTVSGIPNKFIIKEFEVGETVYVYKTKPKYVNGEDWDCSYYMHEAKILKKRVNPGCGYGTFKYKIEGKRDWMDCLRIFESPEAWMKWAKQCNLIR